MFKLFLFIFCITITTAICEELLCSKEHSVCGGTKGIKCCENQHLKCNLVDDSIAANGTCVKTCGEDGDLCGNIANNRECCSDINLSCALQRAAGGRCYRNLGSTTHK